MYVPKYYQMKDYTKIKDFMMHNNFVTIITYDELKPLATHLPVNIEEKDNTLYVSGHFVNNGKQSYQMNISLSYSTVLMPIFPLHGMKKKMFQLGITKVYMRMAKDIC